MKKRKKILIRNYSKKEKMADRNNTMQQFSRRQTEQWKVICISFHILPNGSYHFYTMH
jgi:hypothetical protein